jgi:hypothetical protein
MVVVLLVGYGVLGLVLSLGAAGTCEASGEIVFVLDD